jgi:hypothetical protein
MWKKIFIVCCVMCVMGAGCCKCKNYLTECTDGYKQPELPGGNCVWEPLTDSCGGCTALSKKWGIAQCVDGNGVGCENCDDECRECSITSFTPGAQCAYFRNDPEGCIKEPCAYIAKTYPGWKPPHVG